MLSCFREAARRVTGERLGRGACSVRPVTTRDSRRPRGRRWGVATDVLKRGNGMGVCLNPLIARTPRVGPGQGAVIVQRMGRMVGTTDARDHVAANRRIRGSHRQSLCQNGAREREKEGVAPASVTRCACTHRRRRCEDEERSGPTPSPLVGRCAGRLSIQPCWPPPRDSAAASRSHLTRG